jgi:hypothetical protein
VGRFDSIKNMKGASMHDRVKDERENILRRRKVDANGPLYTKSASSDVLCLEDEVESGHRMEPGATSRAGREGRNQKNFELIDVAGGTRRLIRWVWYNMKFCNGHELQVGKLFFTVWNPQFSIQKLNSSRL